MSDKTTETPEVEKQQINLADMAAGLSGTGLDPDIEKKAEEYSKRDWQMTVKPMLEKVFPDLGEDKIAEVQEAMFQHKYSVLENAQNNKVEAKKANRRW